MARKPASEDCHVVAQRQQAPAKRQKLPTSKRRSTGIMPIVQVNSLQSFIKSAMLSSDYTDFFGLPAPSMDQTVSRTRLKAMLRYHTMYHATPRPYLDVWEAPAVHLCLQASEATSIIACQDDSFVDALNIVGFLSRTETIAQKMTYPDFLWDQKCYQSYFMVTLTNLRAQWPQRGFVPLSHRCLNFNDTTKGDLVVGMVHPESIQGRDGYVIGVVQTKIRFGGQHGSHACICCPWKIGYKVDPRAEPPPVHTQVQYQPEWFVTHDLFAHHSYGLCYSLTCLAKHIWSAGIIQRSWKVYLQKCSMKRTALRNAMIEQELSIITLHPSRLLQHVDIHTARRISQC